MANSGRRWLELDMAVTENGTPMTQSFQTAAKRRGRIADLSDDVFWRPDHPQRTLRLWVVDHVLGPQTIPRFLDFLSSGRLPGGQQSSRPRPSMEEIDNMAVPYSDWAPEPFKGIVSPEGESVMSRIDSVEDGLRLRSIGKELHGMKSRIWEGLPPLSERRWMDLNLDDEKNFDIACHYIKSVINVFLYLNTKVTKSLLRDTFNRIYDHLEEFEKAVNAGRLMSTTVEHLQHVAIAGLWYEFIKAYYNTICSRAHHWVIEHIQRLRLPLMERARVYVPRPELAHTVRLGNDERQWDLMDEAHDLDLNTAQADFAISIPTDGYQGNPRPAFQGRVDNTLGGFRRTPISWHPSLSQRRNDYNARVKFLRREEQYLGNSPDFVFQVPRLGSSEGIAGQIRFAMNAQRRARAELRGAPQPLGTEPWIAQARRSNLEGLSYVAYRLHHGSKTYEWDNFKAIFEADIKDWGRDMKAIDDVREKCKIQWLDGKDLDIKDGDVEAARKHFQTYMASQPDTSGVRKDVFLIVDGDVVKSYLASQDKFVLAVQAEYDPSDASGLDESPGYSGTLRVLGSLLWDDLGAMLITQGARLKDLWPFAMAHPLRIYQGPKVEAVLKFSSAGEKLQWDIANIVIPIAVRYMVITGRR